MPPRRTASFRCFSPTRRCETTSTASQKIGASNAAPQTWASIRRAVSTVQSAAASGPSLATRCAGGAVLRVRAAACRALRKSASDSGAIVQPAAIAWPPKRLRSCGWCLLDQVERVAQVQALDRPARALEGAVLAEGEDEGRPVQPVLEARGDDADHALVEVGVVDGEGGIDLAGRGHGAVDQPLGLLAHPGLDRAPLAVDGVERGGELGGAARVVGQQALDAERHVGQPPGGVEARAEGEAEVLGAGLARVAAGGGEEGGDARLHPPGADPLQALGDEAAVVAIEADDVGDGAERHQVEQRVEPRLVRLTELAPFAQLRTQRQQHVEGDAAAGELLAREAAAGLARVDDDIGRRAGAPRRRRSPAGGGR